MALLLTAFFTTRNVFTVPVTAVKDDPDVYPGTNVLKNLADIHDPKELEAFEAAMTFKQIGELLEHLLSGSFNTRHLQQIHHYIFQDVYAWAGQFRTVNISRPGQAWFARPDYIKPALDRLFDQLRNEKGLRGLEKTAFVARMAHYLGEMNAIHPFREGNGRAQREFIRELAVNAGYAIAWSGIAIEEMRDASIQSFQKGENSAFQQVLFKAISPLRHG